MEGRETVEVDIESSELSKSMHQKLDTLYEEKLRTENVTIFCAPGNIRQTKKNLFEPSVISIGPFHRGHTNLHFMEEKKWQFLRDFLSRQDNISLNLCISEMKLLEICFVLECFFKWYKGQSILDVGWNSASIFSDLLLLENQIPFFIVEKLCKISIPEDDRECFRHYLAASTANGLTTNSENPGTPSTIHHLVHLCYQCSVPNPIETESFDVFMEFQIKRSRSWQAAPFPFEN